MRLSLRKLAEKAGLGPEDIPIEAVDDFFYPPVVYKRGDRWEVEGERRYVLVYLDRKGHQQATVVYI